MEYKTKTKLILPFKITFTGNTTQPHIHYNLQDNLLGYKAKALPAQFEKIEVNGVVKELYEPVRFEQVSNLK